jgi:integrase
LDKNRPSKNQVKRRAAPKYWVLIKGRLYARLQYKTENGRYKVKYRPIADKRGAKRAVEEMRRELEHHGEETLLSDKMGFKHLADDYEEKRIFPAAYSNGVKVSGRRSVIPVKSALRILVDHFGTRPIRSIKAVDIENYKQERLRVPTNQGRQRKVASVNRELELLRAMLNYAVQNEWLVRTPFALTKGVISKAAETQRDRILTVEEEQRLLDVSVGRRRHLRPLLVCALDTAMRRGEIFKMRWADVRFDSNEIFIPQTNTKTQESRTVGMTRRLRQELEDLWEVSPKSPNESVFGISTTVKTAFKSLCEAASVDGFRFHDCRHTATTRMIAAGCPHTEVMKITGHTQMKTFLRYLNVKSETTSRVASALDIYLDQSANAAQLSRF